MHARYMDAQWFDFSHDKTYELTTNHIEPGPNVAQRCPHSAPKARPNDGARPFVDWFFDSCTLARAPNHNADGGYNLLVHGWLFSISPFTAFPHSLALSAVQLDKANNWYAIVGVPLAKLIHNAILPGLFGLLFHCLVNLATPAP